MMTIKSFIKRHNIHQNIPGAGEDPDGGVDVEPEGPGHREDLLAVH